jgi:hypothetical protein
VLYPVTLHLIVACRYTCYCYIGTQPTMVGASSGVTFTTTIRRSKRYFRISFPPSKTEPRAQSSKQSMSPFLRMLANQVASGIIMTYKHKHQVSVWASVHLSTQHR